ncbi:hypothetical protein ACMWD3_06970 [Gardnerella swidsinskii]|uniref:Uncharacterized protein n=1 Tax=Gardnerella swidsinskii TaxID=2792979 RepID=A0ABM6GHG9_9BIFI|nr:hypothetical protein BVL65_00390 [Gardnerella vaginalis]MDK7189610.1 hypothetical protein [Bifidobacterium sp. UMB1230]
MSDTENCAYCGQAFTQNQAGGSSQIYCSANCRKKAFLDKQKSEATSRAADETKKASDANAELTQELHISMERYEKVCYEREKLYTDYYTLREYLKILCTDLERMISENYFTVNTNAVNYEMWHNPKANWRKIVNKFSWWGIPETLKALREYDELREQHDAHMQLLRDVPGDPSESVDKLNQMINDFSRERSKIVKQHPGLKAILARRAQIRAWEEDNGEEFPDTTNYDATAINMLLQQVQKPEETTLPFEPNRKNVNQVEESPLPFIPKEKHNGQHGSFDDFDFFE